MSWFADAEGYLLSFFKASDILGGKFRDYVDYCVWVFRYADSGQVENNED